ncbi:phosphate ABC transporter substrate-binding protein PstS [uncultured Microbacterium sp.]|uniref:phosphate ABC transporter substrate-binding protein PstS n=1 Tax=uncultured Microbacterium sp. TaxID=191216 RepID=UPI0035CA48D4
MNTHRPARRGPRAALLLRLLGALLGIGLVVNGAVTASAANYLTISGSGSSWAGNALKQWVSEVKTEGVTVNYKDGGSSTGRKEFAQGVAQFAISEIPYTGDTADATDSLRPDFAYGMLPVVAGGTSLMYNLPVAGSRFTDLKLSPAAIAGIFSGQINRWNDPAIAADNPGVALPDQRITVVVRSDGSGATAQFTLWMKRQFPDAYAHLCSTTGACDPNSATSYYPINSVTMPNIIAQNQSSGVTNYTADNAYTINYDEYSYAQGVGFPVAQVKNTAGFYTVPSPGAVAVALTQTQINTDASSLNYLSQDLSNVYSYGDPRTYPLSMYSYAIVPHQETSYFTATQGATIGYLLRHSLCDGQQSMGDLGYSPLPMNLVLAALDQVVKVPGVDAETNASIAAIKTGTLSGGSNPCNNPTFQPGDSPSHNVLVDSAPFPAGCDATCQGPWKLAGAGVNNGPSYGDGTTAGAADGATGTNAGATSTTTGTGTTGTGAAGAPGTTATKAQSCDPDTGVCTSIDTLNASAAGNAKAVPAVIPGHLGWTTAQNLMIISGILVIGLVLAPPLVSGLARRRR